MPDDERQFSLMGVMGKLKRRKKMLREAAMEADGKKKKKKKQQQPMPVEKTSMETEKKKKTEKEKQDFDAYLESLRQKHKRGEL